jgi:hypothetical protein
MFPFWYIESFVRTKHRKTECVQFLEGGLPCEDCEWEGHPPACGWHRDWHRCDCGAFDLKTSDNSNTIHTDNPIRRNHEVGEQSPETSQSR